MIDAQGSDDEEVTSEIFWMQPVASRRASTNVSYWLLTATPKTKTLELFGACQTRMLRRLKLIFPKPIMCTACARR